MSSPAATIGTRFVIGVFIALLGIVMTLDNLNVLDASGYLHYWPVILIAVGALKLLDASTRVAGVALVVAGAVLLALTTRLVHLSVFDLWPLLLIGGGLFLVAQAMGFRPAMDRDGTQFAVLSNRNVTIDTPSYAGGRLVAFMGGAALDFSNAGITASPAVLEVFVLMGGIEMRVPDGWEVIGEAVPFMGGVEIETRSRSTGRQLIIRGFIMMGGLHVKAAGTRNA